MREEEQIVPSSGDEYGVKGDLEGSLGKGQGSHDDESQVCSSAGSVISTNSVKLGTGTGWFTSTLLITNAALGAGLLNFPAAFHQAGGILTGWLVQLGLLCFIVPALLILVHCSDLNGSKTLQEVLSFTLGKRAEKFTPFYIALYCFGSCITLLIIIGDQFDRMFASMYGNQFCHDWYLNRNFTVVVTSIVFILPFCYPKKIDFLKNISSVGVLAIIYVTFLTIIQYYSGNYIPGEVKTQPTVWTDVFLVVPTICFGYQCHISVIPIYSCFKNRNIKQFTLSMSLALTTCVLAYTVAASFGYLTFGSNVSSDILKNYNGNDPWVALGIIAISIKFITTYPILNFCGNAAVHDLWFGGSSSDPQGKGPFTRERLRVILITVWFFLSLIFAIAIPNIGSVIKILGSCAAIFIFIFPGLCLLKIAKKIQGSRARFSLKFVAGVFLTVGSFIFVCVLSQGIIVEFISGNKEEEIPLCLEKLV